MKKYVLEVNEPIKNENGENLWRASHFNTLVFDQIGLSKLGSLEVELEHAKHDAYMEGSKEAWEVAQLVISLTDKQVQAIFKNENIKTASDLIQNYSISELNELLSSCRR